VLSVQTLEPSLRRNSISTGVAPVEPFSTASATIARVYAALATAADWAVSRSHRQVPTTSSGEYWSTSATEGAM